MKTLVSIILALILAAATGLPVSAQVAGRAIISPVPIYPREGKIPEAWKDNFVFLDPAAGEVVVSYPDEQQPGMRVTLRFGRHDQVDPVIGSVVVRQSGGLYHYEYTVRNGARARLEIKLWSLVVGSQDSQLTGAHPTWRTSSAASPFSRPGSIRPEVVVTWSAGARNMHLPKGLAIGGFRVVSSYKPGLTLAYAQAAVESEYTEAAARTLPPAVAEQLSRIMSPDWDTAQVMTVGPKFTTGDPKELIAMDFHRGLSQLAVTGALKADSPFVSSAISALISHMQSPGSAGPPLDFLEKAAPGLETEVAVAMKLSLQ